MSWPLSQDYNEAIQSPATNFADADLKKGEAVANALGLPIPFSGNFADVYQVRCPDGSRWAVKCFTREAIGLRERYQEISAHLKQAKLPFTVDFSYLEQGIRVAGKWYPILKMQWVEGLTLNQFVAQYLDKPAMLEALLQLWAKMGKYLRTAQVGHCDLQHGNVLLVPGSTPNALALKLIDYDGMWVPSLAKSKSGEVGHANYQHPGRLREGTYNLEVDRFPLLLVATAMRALKADKSLWAKYDNGDNLLFKESDLAAPGQSALFEELASLPDSGLVMLAAQVRAALKGPLESTALLEEAMPDVRPTPSLMSKRPSRLAPATAVAVAPGKSDLDFDSAVRSTPGGSFVKKATAKHPESAGIPLAAWIGGAVALVVVAAAIGGVTLWAMSGRSRTSESRIVQKIVSPAGPQISPASPTAGEDAHEDSHAKTPPTAPPTEELLEGESLAVLARSGDFWIGPQKMLEWPEYQWSNDAQLYGKATKVGDFVDFSLPVPVDGKYSVVVYMSKAPDYGVVQFSLDEMPLGKPIDGFEPATVVRSGPISLGAADLKKGNSVLRLGVTGTNEKSVGARYFFGLDCVILKPAPPTPAYGEPAIAGLPFDSGWDKAIDPDHDCPFFVGKNRLRIELPAKDHDLGTERGKMNAPRLLRDVEGDFTAQVRVDGDFAPAGPSTAAGHVPFVGAGLVVMVNERTYLRLERAAVYNGANKAAAYVNLEWRFNAYLKPLDGSKAAIVEGKPTYLRIGREKGKVFAAVSQDGQTWIDLPTLGLTLPFPTVKVGVEAVTSSAAPFQPRFDGFLLTADNTAVAVKPGTAVKPALVEKALLKPPMGNALAKAREAVKQEFKHDYDKLNAPSDRSDFAAKLRTEAFTVKDNPDRQYALFIEARDLAARGEDLAASQKIITDTAAMFDIDPKEAKQASLLAAGATFSGKAAAKAYLAEVGPLLQEAKADDDYERAALFLPAVRKAAADARDPDAAKTAATLEKLQKEFEAVKKDLQTLKEKPDDPDANLTVGKFYCFQKQDYDKGDPYLAKSGNLALATAATKDVDDPKDVKEQVALADAWMKLGDNLALGIGPGARRRAYDWYSKALPNLSDKEEGRVKARVADLTKQFPEVLAAWDNLDVSRLEAVGNAYLRVKRGEVLSTRLALDGPVEIELVARSMKAPMTFEFMAAKQPFLVWQVNLTGVTGKRLPKPRSWGTYGGTNFQFTPNVWVTYTCKLDEARLTGLVDGKPYFFESEKNDLSKSRTFQLLAGDQTLEVQSFKVKPLDKP